MVDLPGEAIPRWTWDSYPEQIGYDRIWSIGYIGHSGDGSFSLRFLQLTLLAAAFATISWFIHWRFSLRTLLIGMTVAAIGLGWIVYALR